MVNRVLFIDFENVQGIDLSEVPLDVGILVFYGMMQKKLPEALVVQAQPLGPRLKWYKAAGQGPNALDFHIAFYLGQELAQRPDSECVVISRDTGFDPLIRHLRMAGHHCRRAESLPEAFPADADSQTAHFPRLIALLKKEKARPARRSGLAGKLKCWFPQLSDGDRLALLRRLFDESHVREAESKLTYDLPP
jgi:PIN domain